LILARPARWSPPLVALHWLAAALILELLAHGWIMVHGTSSAGTAFGLYQSHKSLGFVVLAVTAARLFLRLSRLSRKAPPPLGPRWERPLAQAVQAALYGLTLVAIVSGWLVVSTSPLPIPTRVFDLVVVPDIARPDANLFAVSAAVHGFSAWSILGLVALHVAGAFKHHVIERDEVLARMLPKRLAPRSKTPAVGRR
jgi:cytochrome b561